MPEEPYVDPTEVAAMQGQIVGSIYEREIDELCASLRLILDGRQLGLLDFKDHALSVASEALRRQAAIREEQRG